MTEVQRIRKLFLQIQDRLKRLGSTNRNIFASLTMDQTFSFQNFMNKLHFLGIDVTEQDLKIIWCSIGISQDSMKFIDFVKFMQFDVDMLTPVQIRSQILEDDFYQHEKKNDFEKIIPKNEQNFSKSEILIDLLQQIVIDCMNADSKMTGKISQRELTDICISHGVNFNNPKLKELFKQNDFVHSGLISYFLFATQICQLEHSSSNQRSSNYEKQNNFGFSKERKFNYQSCPAKSEFDYQRNTNPGYIPSTSKVDQFVSKSASEGKSSDDIVSRINEIIEEKIGSAHSAFRKWKGENGKISARGLHEGLFQYGKISISIHELEKLIPREMNLGEFIKMIGNSSIPSNQVCSSHQNAQRQRKMTADEEFIYSIVDQIKDPKWEDIIFRSNEGDEMACNLMKIGIKVDSIKLRIIIVKMGKTGVIDAIKRRL
jgi:Ca2+-binding EF-hand superfamily protein